MTNNQIAFLALQENRRHNLVSEATDRYRIDKDAETKRYVVDTQSRTAITTTRMNNETAIITTGMNNRTSIAVANIGASASITSATIGANAMITAKQMDIDSNQLINDKRMSNDVLINNAKNDTTLQAALYKTKFGGYLGPVMYAAQKWDDYFDNGGSTASYLGNHPNTTTKKEHARTYSNWKERKSTP